MSVLQELARGQMRGDAEVVEGVAVDEVVSHGGLSRRDELLILAQPVIDEVARVADRRDDPLLLGLG